ncbi:ABC transporter six-transmembrane domain-containing protein [Rhodobacteraceae bacterium M382]|nr:ABC transporter six-transmembrane domain-containing protein [Rhodobacteraceae bacterium M382]
MRPSARRPAGRLAGRPLTLRGLLGAFWPQISVTWGLTLAEVVMFALIPLLIGMAIDGLLAANFEAFILLGAVLAALVLLGTLRRVYDTRAYGLIRVELGKELAKRSEDIPVSRLNARLGMGRELVNFLESDAPESMTAVVRVLAALVILAGFHPGLALAAMAALTATMLTYALAHNSFFRLNATLNARAEQQVGVLETRSGPKLGAHLLSLRKSEIRISDTEGLIYGTILTALLGMEMFNLWFATQSLGVTAGGVFSIVTYSWDFVESALILPMTLQTLSRLSEITIRINQMEAAE